MSAADCFSEEADLFPGDPIMRAKWRLLRMESAECRARDALIAAQIDVKVARIEVERAEKAEKAARQNAQEAAT